MSRQSLEGQGIISLEQVADVVQLSGSIGALVLGPHHLSVHTRPAQSVEFWTIGWPPHTADTVGPVGSLHRVGAAGTQAQDIQAVRDTAG